MADRLALPDDEIVVTPEMEAAGASVLCRMERAFADEGYWATEVFKAMASAWNRSDSKLES